MELTEFIKARLAEDEALAMSAAADVKRLAGRPNWSAELAPIVIDAEDPEWAIADLSPFVDDECLARHIAHYDPARALREVAAKRAILARHKPLHGRYGLCCAHCSRDIDSPGLGIPWPCADVRDLVTAWSDHPDYSGDWKP